MNLFDITHQDDLPEGVRNQLKGSRLTIQKKVLALFEKQTDPVTIDQVMIAYYRRWNEVKSRGVVAEGLNRLVFMSVAGKNNITRGFVKNDTKP